MPPKPVVTRPLRERSVGRRSFRSSPCVPRSLSCHYLHYDACHTLPRALLVTFSTCCLRSHPLPQPQPPRRAPHSPMLALYHAYHLLLSGPTPPTDGPLRNQPLLARRRVARLAGGPPQFHHAAATRPLVAGREPQGADDAACDASDASCWDAPGCACDTLYRVAPGAWWRQPPNATSVPGSGPNTAIQRRLRCRRSSHVSSHKPSSDLLVLRLVLSPSFASGRLVRCVRDIPGKESDEPPRCHGRIHGAAVRSMPRKLLRFLFQERQCAKRHV